MASKRRAFFPEISKTGAGPSWQPLWLLVALLLSATFGCEPAPPGRVANSAVRRFARSIDRSNVVQVRLEGGSFYNFNNIRTDGAQVIGDPRAIRRMIDALAVSSRREEVREEPALDQMGMPDYVAFIMKDGGGKVIHIYMPFAVDEYGPEVDRAFGPYRLH
jgi:hypothetical protein